MKRIIVLTACAFFLFSSFITAPALSSGKTAINVKAPAGVSFKAQDSYTWYNVYGYVCNGDIIYFPYLTVSYDLHGVDNGNIYMIQGKNRLNGTGTSIYTGENYVADFETKFNQKIPLQNGALVVKEKTNNCFTGDQGTRDCFSFSYHLTFNAKGELTADPSKMEIICE